jgi:hypothetical protein
VKAKWRQREVDCAEVIAFLREISMFQFTINIPISAQVLEIASETFQAFAERKQLEGALKLREGWHNEWGN